MTHRYSGSSCKALAHWQKHGWHWCQKHGEVDQHRNGVSCES
jgi:hypothetical protein